MSARLKPCPHCGGIAEIDTLWTYRAIYDGQMRRGVIIYCLSCDAQMTRCYADHPGEEREDVCDALVKAWNTRALEREAKAEPVAWLLRFGENGQYRSVSIVHPGATYADQELTPLYASPPAPESKDA